MARPRPPVREVTFLLTDIEGSTKMWEQHPEEMSEALTHHEEIFDDVVGRHGGVVVKSKGEGDSVFCTFDDPAAAVAAAVDVQRALGSHPWPTPQPIKVRMSVHTGEAEHRADGDWYGTVVNRAARVRAVAHGGQVVISQAAVIGCGHQLPDGVELVDLGRRRLKDLTEPEHLWQVTHPDLPATFPPLASLDERPHNLPQQPTPLVGREELLTQARTMILSEGVRLLTLTGPGGVGKTRVGLQLAADLLDTFDDGAFAVWLAATTWDDVVAGDVAEALGVAVPADTDPAAALIEHLSSRQVLLVLDNAEQVVAPVAELAARVLAECPGVTIVVTSREWLNVRAEHELAVDPLGLPQSTDEVSAATVRSWSAPALFLDRVAATRRDLDLDDGGAAAVAQICLRLDGLPLALELAAARVRGSSITAVRDGLTSALEALTEGPRDLPARQQALRSTIAWSYELLDDHGRELLRRLAVFAGGWTIEAAVKVTGWEGDRLEAGLVELANKSFVRRTDDPEQHVRWSMLETIREFALDELEGSPDHQACEERHGAWCVDLARTADEQLTGPEQAQWVNRLAAEHDNLRRALHVHHGTGRFVALAGTLTRFWAIRGHWKEGRQALEAAVTSEGGSKDDSIRAHIGAGLLAELTGVPTVALARYDEARRLADESGDEASVALAHHRLGALARGTGDPETAADHYARSRQIRERLDDQRGLGMLDSEEGTLALARNDLDGARELYERAAHRLRKVGDHRELAAAVANAGNVAIRQGRLDAAADLLEEAASVARDVGDVQRQLLHEVRVATIELHRGSEDVALERAQQVADEAGRNGYERIEADALQVASTAAFFLGDIESALDHRRHATDRCRRVGDLGQLSQQLAALAALMGEAGRDDEAAETRREALRVAEQLGDADLPVEIALDLIPDPGDDDRPAPPAALAECAEVLARMASAAADHERASRFLGAAEVLRGQVPSGLARVAEAARAVIGRDRFDALRSEGASLGPQIFDSGLPDAGEGGR